MYITRNTDNLLHLPWKLRNMLGHRGQHPLVQGVDCPQYPTVK